MSEFVSGAQGLGVSGRLSYPLDETINRGPVCLRIQNVKHAVIHFKYKVPAVSVHKSQDCGNHTETNMHQNSQQQKKRE
jgi:hypothetical protein